MLNICKFQLKYIKLIYKYIVKKTITEFLVAKKSLYKKCSISNKKINTYVLFTILIYSYYK